MYRASDLLYVRRNPLHPHTHTPLVFPSRLTCFRNRSPNRVQALFIPMTRFCAEEHRARVDGRATARHLHGKIERAARCLTMKVSAESAGAVASNVFLESLTTRQSGRLAPDGVVLRGSREGWASRV